MHKSTMTPLAALSNKMQHGKVNSLGGGMRDNQYMCGGVILRSAT